MEHAYFEEAVIQYENFLAKKQGWIEDRIAACLKLSDCYGRLCKHDLQWRSLFRSLEFATPRPEVCCKLGAMFMEENRMPEAIFWYESATRLEEPSVTGASINYSYCTWLPYLQLCVCYDRLGQYARANECNEQALKFNPNHPSMLSNRTYLADRLRKEPEL
ncbi:Tetratricopeptide repeat protein [compost metagenome]